MDASIFKARRERFLARLEDAAAVIPPQPHTIRNGDVHHGYRQASDLLYLTGFPEPEAVAVLSPKHETPFVLFVRPKNRDREIWDGRRHGVEGAKEIFGADAAFPIEELPAKLPELLAPALHLVAPLGIDAGFDRLLIDLLARSRRSRQKDGKGPVHIQDPWPLLHEMRLVKGPEEVAALQRAAEITAAGHRRAMEVARPGVNEREVQAALEETFRRLGSPRVGYGSIVASGDNATILHYVENDQEMAEGDLLLVDAGAEYDHYTADVTRTFPVNGRFTAPQRRIYDLVLRAQLEAIDQAWPGRPWERVHDRARSVLIEGLIELGVLEGTVEEHLKKDDYKKYYMHGTSHWLGMDVHDVGCYRPGGQARPLEPGMVLTVEPGLYFHADVEGVPEAYRGIGVRIEDDVLVTETGPVVLTAAAPKTVEEIEAARHGSRAPVTAG